MNLTNKELKRLRKGIKVIAKTLPKSKSNKFNFATIKIYEDASGYLTINLEDVMINFSYEIENKEINIKCFS